MHCFIYFSGDPREYLEHYVFPVLLPALEEMLRMAKTEKCFEVSFQAVFENIYMYMLILHIERHRIKSWPCLFEQKTKFQQFSRDVSKYL